MYIHSKHLDEIDFSIERWNWEFFEILLQVAKMYETNPGMELTCKWSFCSLLYRTSARQ